MRSVISKIGFLTAKTYFRLKGLPQKLNILGAMLQTNPLKLFLFAWLVGVLITIWSYYVGTGYFSVHAKIIFDDATLNEAKEISLGFIPQLNYGPWYFLPFLCPAVFLLSALTARATERFTPLHLKEKCSFIRLLENPLIACCGVVILLGFVGKNIYIEYENHNTLGLGWVQALSLKEVAQGVKDTNGAYKLENKIFKYSKKNADGKVVMAKGVVIAEVKPENPGARNYAEMVVFIIAAKTWVGLWESLTVYLALLTLFWGFNIYRNLTDEAILEAKDGRYGFKFVDRPASYILIIGILINLFCILRYTANVYKGSYGQWDQYWSLITVSPAVALIVVGLLIVYRIHECEDCPNQTLCSKPIWILLGVWATLFIYFAYLFVGYVDTSTQELIAWLLSRLPALK